MFGIVTTFVATRSGLTRFEDHRTEADKLNSTGERPFFDTHTRATEELYYRRAVDFHSINSSAFVFSVPFDASQRGGQILVTGSHAIFIGTGKQRAPAAVVGLQFKHSVFKERFFNITNKYSKEICSSDEIDCFLLDNNAFVIVSEVQEHTGKFFGEIDNLLLQAMVTAKVYRKVHMYDYQAICLDILPSSGPASILFTPINHLKSIIVWVWSRIIMLYINLLYNMWCVDASECESYDYDRECGDTPENRNNKSRPRPCDKEYDLYEMVEAISEEPIKGDHKECHHSGCSRPFIVQYVPYTNLVMLVLQKSCPCESSSVKLEPKEVVYNETVRCHLLKTEMYRKRPTTCHNYHPQERDIKQCGRGSKLIPSVILMVLCFVKVFLGNT